MLSKIALIKLQTYLNKILSFPYHSVASKSLCYSLIHAAELKTY